MSPSVATIVCADWSGRPPGREVYAADAAARRVGRLAPPAGGWTVASVVATAGQFCGRGAVLLGFDAPLGVPESYWRAVLSSKKWGSPASFADWLPALAGDENFFEPVARPKEWSVWRPFLAVPPGKGSRRAFESAFEKQGIAWRRRLDGATGAKPLFIASGIPGCVGGSARDLWRGLAAWRAAGPLTLWPFDGPLDALLADQGVVIAEIYPRLAYGLAAGGRAGVRLAPAQFAKTKEPARRRLLGGLRRASWARKAGVQFADLVAARESDDAFDALVAAAAILRCVLEGLPLFDPSLVDPIAEGSMLLARADRTHPDLSGQYDLAGHEGANMPTRVSEVVTQARRATEDDLRAAPRDGRKYELVDGEIVVSPAGVRHSRISIELAARLLAFAKERGLGHVFGTDVGFRLPGGNVRSPDASFVAAGRFPEGELPEDFGSVAPDLAVEVVSPGDRPRHILDKVGEYLEAGVRLVWVIDPRKAKAVAYRSLSDVRELGPDGALDGEEVLPGFRCELREILK